MLPYLGVSKKQVLKFFQLTGIYTAVRNTFPNAHFYHLYTVNVGDVEFSAMMNENWTQVKAPLLVLSCVEKEITPSLSCATVVELLQLRQLNRPWQVSHMVV